MDEQVQVLDDRLRNFRSKYVTCSRRWLNNRIKINLIRLDEYTIELKLMTFIDGERRCIRIIPSSAKLVSLFYIINDMIPVIVNRNIENDFSFPNDCQSVHILVSQPSMKPLETNDKLMLSSEKTDISDGSFSIASRCPDLLPTYVLPNTALRRIAKVLSSRYLLLLLLQRIKEMVETLPDDCEIMWNSQYMPVHIETLKLWNFYRTYGYQLLDGSLGLSFYDRTNLVLLPNFKGLYYIDKWGNVRYFQDEQCCPRFPQFKLHAISELKSAITNDEETNNDRQNYDIAYSIRRIRWKSSTAFFFNTGRLEIIFDVGKKLIFSPFSKPVCITPRKKLVQVTKSDCTFAVQVCTVLVQKYYR